MFENCPHNKNKQCPFAGYSLGVLRCGEMTGKLELNENDVYKFEVCAKINIPKSRISNKTITTNIHTSSIKVKSPNKQRKTNKPKISKPKTGSLF